MKLVAILLLGLTVSQVALAASTRKLASLATAQVSGAGTVLGTQESFGAGIVRTEGETASLGGAGVNAGFASNGAGAAAATADVLTAGGVGSAFGQGSAGGFFTNTRTRAIATGPTQADATGDAINGATFQDNNGLSIQRVSTLGATLNLEAASGPGQGQAGAQGRVNNGRVDVNTFGGGFDGSGVAGASGFGADNSNGQLTNVGGAAISGSGQLGTRSMNIGFAQIDG